MRQIDANAPFFHSELGIRADFPVLSRQLIHPRNAGIMADAAQSNAMFAAWWMFAGLSVMTLGRISKQFVEGEILDLRKHVGDDPQTRAGQHDPNPVDLSTKATKRERLAWLILRQLEEVDDSQDGRDTSAKVIPKAPSKRGALEKPAKDKAHGETKWLAES